METKIIAGQLQDDIDEMEATIERLQGEIQRLKEQRDALTQGNLALYHELTRVDI
jgi:FtsZ-binding cell division protein ZapB